MAVNLDVNEEMKRKNTRRIVLILLSLFVLAIIGVMIYLSTNGKHNKFTYEGFENNIPDKENTKLQPDISKQINAVIDSVKQPNHSKEKKVEKAGLPKRKPDTSQKTKYDIHDNKSDAPVMIGDGNTQTNNFGDVPKEPNTQDLLQITSQIPKKTDTIELRQSTTNEKNKVFCQKLAYKLVQIGYVNIRLDDKAVHMGIESAGIHVMPPIDDTHIVWVDCNY